jgi:hypothetical protein
MAAPRVQKKSLDYPDETRDFGQGQMQIATVTDFKVARLLLQLAYLGGVIGDLRRRKHG